MFNTQSGRKVTSQKCVIGLKMTHILSELQLFLRVNVYNFRRRDSFANTERGGDVLMESVYIEMYYSVHGVQHIVYSTWCTVHGVQYIVYSTWCTVYGVQYMVYSTWCTVHGVQYMMYST